MTVPIYGVYSAQMSSIVSLVFLATLWLVGCQNDGRDAVGLQSTQLSVSSQASLSIDDPAMAPQSIPLRVQAVPAGSADTLSSHPVPDPNTKIIVVDVVNRLVYLPTTGWLNESQFWDVYYHQPEKLTVEIDEVALESMGYHRPSDPAAYVQGQSNGG